MPGSALPFPPRDNGEIARTPERYLLRGRKKLLARLIDVVGNTACFCGRLFRPVSAFDVGKVGRILVIKLDHIGDVIMATSFLLELRQHFPEAQIDVMAKPSCVALLKYNPAVDNIIPFAAKWSMRQTDGDDKREFTAHLSEKYDLVFSMRGDLRENYLAWRIGAPWRVGYAIRGGDFFLTHVAAYDTNIHQTDRDRELFSCLGLPQKEKPLPRIFLQEEETQQAAEFLRKSGVDLNRSMIVIAPQAASVLKAWPVERFIRVAQAMQNPQASVVCMLPPEGEKIRREFAEKAPHVILPEPVDLRILAGIFSHAQVVICNDSGPMHLAAAVGTKVVAVFGATCDDITGPPPGCGQVLAPTENRPRWYAGTPPPPEDDCLRALESVSVESVVAAAENILREIKN
jgi:lipopolysaccharide heptosyltransferase II